VFKRYVCILIALTKHTYAMKYNFIDFHVLKFCDFKIGTIKIFFVMDVMISKFMIKRNIEFYCYFHDAMFHITLVHSPLLKNYMDFMD